MLYSSICSDIYGPAYNYQNIPNLNNNNNKYRNEDLQ